MRMKIFYPKHMGSHYHRWSMNKIFVTCTTNDFPIYNKDRTQMQHMSLFYFFCTIYNNENIVYMDQFSYIRKHKHDIFFEMKAALQLPFCLVCMFLVFWKVYCSTDIDRLPIIIVTNFNGTIIAHFLCYLWCFYWCS